MFHHYFVNTRTSIDHIHKQLQTLLRIISLSTQVLFIGYYVYLIVINLEMIGFLVIYAAMLALSLVSLVFEIYYIEKKGQTRLDKRISVEKKRKSANILLGIRVLLKIAAIALSGIELVKYAASEMQIITFTLSIVLLFFYLAFSLIIYVINKDIDLIRLSIESDVNSSKMLTKLLKSEKKEYTEQELQILSEIDNRSKEFLEIENAKNQSAELKKKKSWFKKQNKEKKELE